MSYHTLRDPPWMSGPPDPEPRHCDAAVSVHEPDCVPDEHGDCDCARCTCDDHCRCACDECEEARAYEAACEPDPNEGVSPYGDDE